MEWGRSEEEIHLADKGIDYQWKKSSKGHDMRVIIRYEWMNYKGRTMRRIRSFSEP